MNSYSLTDKGMVRSANQDFFFSSDAPVGNLPNLYIVADGMGGHNAGEFASSFAVETIKAGIAADPSMEAADIMTAVTKAANRRLYDEAYSDFSKVGCGTTIVEASIENGILTVLNIGDSRLYLVADDSIRQITRDHSMVEEMVRMGLITHDEAQHHPEKHKITRAFGIEPEVECDIFEVRVHRGDVIIMCSDGLSNMVTDEELFAIAKSRTDIRTKAERAVQLANDAGGSDNITVTFIEV